MFLLISFFFSIMLKISDIIHFFLGTLFLHPTTFSTTLCILFLMIRHWSSTFSFSLLSSLACLSNLSFNILHFLASLRRKRYVLLLFFVCDLSFSEFEYFYQRIRFYVCTRIRGCSFDAVLVSFIY